MTNTTPIFLEPGGAKQVVGSGGTVEVQSGGLINIKTGGALTGAPLVQRARSQVFNIDNGAAVTIDDVIILELINNVTLQTAVIVYVEETTGTVAAGNITLGTTLGGAEVAAATAYEDTKAVGTATSLTLIDTTLGGLPLFCRHTGIAVTAAGRAYVEVTYITSL